MTLHVSIWLEVIFAKIPIVCAEGKRINSQNLRYYKTHLIFTNGITFLTQTSRTFHLQKVSRYLLRLTTLGLRTLIFTDAGRETALYSLPCCSKYQSSVIATRYGNDAPMLSWSSLNPNLWKLKKNMCSLLFFSCLSGNHVTGRGMHAQLYIMHVLIQKVCSFRMQVIRHIPNAGDFRWAFYLVVWSSRRTWNQQGENPNWSQHKNKFVSE